MSHPAGRWTGRNPYTRQTRLFEEPPQALTLGWGVMHSGAHGPPVQGRVVGSDSALVYQYRSCPNPFNPMYRRDLGWSTAHAITATTLNARIDPGPRNYHYFVGADQAEYILEFRTAEGFGRYTGWYRFAEAPGLLIWKRPHPRNPDINFPRLVPADNRRLYNAKRRPVRPTPRAWSAGFAYSWLDRLSDPFGAVEGNGLRETIEAMAHYDVDGHSPPVTLALDGVEHRPVVSDADDESHFRRAGLGVSSSGDDGLLDPASRRAVRNIRVTRNATNPATGSALVDVYFDYWVGSISGTETWSSSPVYVGGDVTIGSGASLTIADNTTVHFLAPLGTDANGPELIVSNGGALTAGTGVTFGTVSRAEARAVRHGLRVEPGGTATLSDLTIADGEHRLQGIVTVGGDLTVGDDDTTTAATLQLERDTQLRFSVDPASELIVGNRSVPWGSGTGEGRGDVATRERRRRSQATARAPAAGARRRRRRFGDRRGHCDAAGAGYRAP